MQNKRICIVGLGYVGLTLSLVLSEKNSKFSASTQIRNY